MTKIPTNSVLSWWLQVGFSKSTFVVYFVAGFLPSRAWLNSPLCTPPPTVHQNFATSALRKKLKAIKTPDRDISKLVNWNREFGIGTDDLEIKKIFMCKGSQCSLKLFVYFHYLWDLFKFSKLKQIRLWQLNCKLSESNLNVWREKSKIMVVKLTSHFQHECKITFLFSSLNLIWFKGSMQ